MASWSMSGAPDLRQALREKAAGHSSFYRRLRAAAAPPAKHQMTNPTTLAPSPPPICDECIDRPRSRDSAVDLDDASNPSILTDALRNLSDDKCYDSGGENSFDDPSSSPYDKREYCEEHCCYHIRSKMILEAQYVEYPFEDKCCEETDNFTADPGRRPSAFSWDGDESSRVRKVRTPSVVISDYSDDIHAGITVEELEYFRSHVNNSPSSGRSSCSNLDSRCGSQLSVLDLEENSRCGSHLSVLDLDDSKSPSVSDCEDEDSGVERHQAPKKIECPQ